jgi:hypothetical protein
MLKGDELGDHAREHHHSSHSMTNDEGVPMTYSPPSGPAHMPTNTNSKYNRHYLVPTVRAHSRQAVRSNYTTPFARMYHMSQHTPELNKRVQSMLIRQDMSPQQQVESIAEMLQSADQLEHHQHYQPEMTLADIPGLSHLQSFSLQHLQQIAHFGHPGQVGGDGGSQDLGAGTFNQGQYTLNESTPTPFSFPGGFPPSALPLDPSAFQWTPEQFQQLFANIPGAPQGGLAGGVPTPESIQAAAAHLGSHLAGAGHQGLGGHLAPDALLASLPHAPHAPQAPHVPAAAPQIAPIPVAPPAVVGTAAQPAVTPSLNTSPVPTAINPVAPAATSTNYSPPVPASASLSSLPRSIS